MARDYAGRYDPSRAGGLTPRSAPLLQDIADFWMREFDLDAEALTAPVKAKKSRKKKSPAISAKHNTQFTDRQGQFLAFIHLYHKLHRRAPAELDMVKYFRVTPPSVHGMIVKLEELGLVTREPGVPRSVRVAIPEKEIPPLEDVVGPPW